MVERSKFILFQVNIQHYKMNRKYKNLEKELESIIEDDENILLVINLFSKYEQSNLELINKLKRSKTIETNKINGALKQTINAHGAIDKRLIGSATKRIYGSLLNNEEPKFKFHFNSFFWGVIISTILILIIL